MPCSWFWPNVLSRNGLSVSDKPLTRELEDRPERHGIGGIVIDRAGHGREPAEAEPGFLHVHDLEHALGKDGRHLPPAIIEAVAGDPALELPVIRQP